MEISSTETNKTVVKRFLEECWGKLNPALVDELFSKEYVMYNQPFFPEGRPDRDFVKGLISYVRGVFPDLWTRIDSIVAEGERVAVAWTSGGTQKGAWEAGIPPTGKKVEWSGIDVHRIVNGKIVETRTVEDGLSLLYQMNALQTWKPPVLTTAPKGPRSSVRSLIGLANSL